MTESMNRLSSADTLLEAIYANEEFDSSVLEVPELPFDY